MNSRSVRSCFSSSAILVFLVVATVQSPACAQEDNKPPKGFTALFNGHDFDNWVGGLGDLDWRKIKAMSSDERAARQKKLDEGAHQHWRVEDGVVVSDGDPHFVLSTPTEYGD